MCGPPTIGMEVYKEFDICNKDYPFEVDGKMWKSVLQYYEASRFIDEDYKEKIRLEDDEMEVYRMSFNKDYQTIDNVDDLRPELMFFAIMTRIKYHPSLVKKLQTTFGKIDFPQCGIYWKYWLQRILTRVRDIT